MATVGMLGVLLFRSQDQATAIELTLAYTVPYVFVLTLIRVRYHVARMALLLVAGFASLVASVSSLARVALILLPATAIIFVASAQSIAAMNRPQH